MCQSVQNYGLQNRQDVFVNILLKVMGVLVHKLMECDIYNRIYGLHVDV